MPKYEVHYVKENTPDYFGPDGQKYEQGLIKIDTDHPIETKDDVREVARQVYRSIDKGRRSVKQLSINHIYNLTEGGEKIELAG